MINHKLKVCLRKNVGPICFGYDVKSYDLLKDKIEINDASISYSKDMPWLEEHDNNAYGRHFLENDLGVIYSTNGIIQGFEVILHENIEIFVEGVSVFDLNDLERIRFLSELNGGMLVNEYRIAFLNLGVFHRADILVKRNGEVVRELDTDRSQGIMSFFADISDLVEDDMIEWKHDQLIWPHS